MNCTAPSPSPWKVVGVLPVDDAVPTLSKVMTSRSAASRSRRAGSQWSIVPRKRIHITSGGAPVLPNRR
jgi:hypothetical protein